MEQQNKSVLRQRFVAAVGVSATVTGVIAVCGLIVWLALVAGYEGTKKIRAWANAPPTVPLAKRQECSKFLNDPKLSILLPQFTGEIMVPGHVYRNMVRDSPIVIYSGVLDTCLGVQTETGIDNNRPYRKLIAVDLLTGEMVVNRYFFGIESQQRKWGLDYQGDVEGFFNDPRNREAILEMKRTAVHQHL